MYNILVVDDSALMRKFMCDIINSIDGYHVTDVCADGETAYKYMVQNRYDAVTMSMTMPTYNGIKILSKLAEEGKKVSVIAVSSSLKEDRDFAIQALDLGAVDFVLRPLKVNSPGMESFSRHLKEALEIAVSGRVRSVAEVSMRIAEAAPSRPVAPAPSVKKSPYDLVAIASSTGGPQALQTLVPMLPGDLGVPVVIVQHMPDGFTASLAERIDNHARLRVTEAKKGEIILPNHAYIAKGGHQLKIVEKTKGVFMTDVTKDPPVNNLRPCADVMFESLIGCSFSKVLCVVLTGMGSDGAAGITALKKKKRIRCFTQDEKSSVVYGMPKAAFERGLSDKVCSITEMAQAIAKELGV